MWDEDPRAFGERFSLSLAEALRYRCTAEHLHEKCKGGADEERNIVAACDFCNRTRHLAKRPKDAASFAKYVQSRMKRGKWHPVRLERQRAPLR
ncbi:HNH endonuclease [Sinorhizobium americanum]